MRNKSLNGAMDITIVVSKVLRKNNQDKTGNSGSKLDNVALRKAVGRMG